MTLNIDTKKGNEVIVITITANKEMLDNISREVQELVFKHLGIVKSPCNCGE